MLEPNSASVGFAYAHKSGPNRNTTKAIASRFDDAEKYNTRGIAYSENGDQGKAIGTFNKAIDLTPNYAIAYNNRGVAYLNKKDFDRAVKDFNTAIQLQPDLVEAYNNRGIAYDSKEECDLAIEDYSKAIKLKPALALAFNNRGNTYYKKEDFVQAIKDLTKSIKLEPNYANAYFNRGNVYQDIGEVDQSITDYTTAIRLKRDDFKYYHNRGNAYLSKHDYDCAVEDYTMVIKLKPQFVDAYVNRGLAYRVLGQLDLAIADYTTAIKLCPRDVDAYNNRGVAYLNKSDFNLALQDFNRVIQLKPDLAPAYVNRGVAYLSNNEVNQAIKDYTRAIGLNPELALVYYNRGAAYLRLKKWEKAKADLITAKNMGMDIIAAFHNTYRNATFFELRYGFKLPEDIAALVLQDFRNRYPRIEEILDTKGNTSESPEVLALVKILRDAGTPLREYLKCSPYFGVKTAPTEVFVVDRTTRDKLIAAHSSSADILKPFLHGQDIRRWQVEPQDQWLIAAHRGIEIDAYPAIRKYLEKYRGLLSKRRGKGKWYELQTSPVEPERFVRPKLVCPHLYNAQTFAVETEGLYCGYTCCIIPSEETWLCGLLNTRIVEWFYSQISKQLGSGELQARSGYIKQIPIPDVNATQKDLVRKLVDYLIYLQKQPTTNSKDLVHANDFVMLKYFEQIINGLFYEFYMPDVLQEANRDLFKYLMAEHLPEVGEICGDKMPTFRALYKYLYHREHPVRVNLFFQDSLKPIRIIEDKW